MASKMTWDVANDRRLFLAILKISKVKIDFDAVAAELSDDAITLTPIAIKRRMERLQAMANPPVKKEQNKGKGVKREAQTKLDADGAPMSKRVKTAGGQANNGDKDGKVKEETIEGAEEDDLAEMFKLEPTGE